MLFIASLFMTTVATNQADTLPKIVARALINEDTDEVKIKSEQGGVAAQQMGRKLGITCLEIS